MGGSASGWSVSRAFAVFDGAAYGGARLRFGLELDGQSLFDSSVDLPGPVTLPFSYMNWSACPKPMELVVRLDFENLIEMENTDVAIYLDTFRLGFLEQGGFGWQTCDE